MKRTAIAIRTGLTFCLCGSLVLAACNSNAPQNKEAADKVSDSARAAQDRLDSLRKTHYRNNDLSIIFLDASSQLMQAQMAMEKAEYAGNKPEMVDSLIINSAKGDTLYYALRRMYEAGAVYAESYAQKDQFRAMRMPDSTKLWLQKHFKGLTPSGALTPLSKFQNDCAVINRIVRR